ncbi:MAG TPA: hypothetical protein VKG45_06570 [Actinomycetes bacterium]|nr:hypothetical protein [Actinomycetes bacterium]
MARLEDHPAPGGPRTPPGAAAPAAGGRLPRWVRWYLGVFLAAFALCGVVGVEAWPLTGWRLFADARSARQAGWQVTAVDAAGREQPLPFGRLPAGYQGHVQVLKGFPAVGPRRQGAVCQAWAAALSGLGEQPAELRVYATVTDLADRRGRVGAPPRRSLRYRCPVEALPGGGVRARVRPVLQAPGGPRGPG